MRRTARSDAFVPPVQFIAPDSLDAADMRKMWDRVILEKREQEVVEALRVLEPELNSIAFLSAASAKNRGSAGIVLGFEGMKKRVPLGSHGEGMRRLLALSLALVGAQDGLLLIDEIDTGLHYSVMAEMWHLVIENARRLNATVVATTHSQDCIRGLADCCAHSATEADDVALHKIEPKLDHAVTLPGLEVPMAVSQHIEVR